MPQPLPGRPYYRLHRYEQKLLRLCKVKCAPTFTGSAHEGQPYLDAVEVLLHELAHARLLGIQPNSEEVNDRLKSLPRYLADRNEVRTVAVVLGVARRLRLRGFDPYMVIWSGHRNFQLQTCDQTRFEGLVLKAGRTVRVRQLVQEVSLELNP